jgi:hypothetical protein
MDFAADSDLRPLAICCIDFSSDFQGKREAGAVAEGETCVSCDGSQIGCKTGLRFGERLNTGEQTQDRVYAWIAGQPKIEEFGPDLGVVGCADDGTFDDIEHTVVDLFVPEDGD